MTPYKLDEMEKTDSMEMKKRMEIYSRKYGLNAVLALCMTGIIYFTAKKDALKQKGTCDEE